MQHSTRCFISLSLRDPSNINRCNWLVFERFRSVSSFHIG